MSEAHKSFALPPWPSPLALLPQAINHLLNQEAWAREKLLPHAGKTLKLVVSPFDLSLSVNEEGFAELAQTDAPHAVRIELPLSSLPQILVQGRPAAMRQMKLEGDADFAQTVSFLVENLRWEVEEDLSKVVGDTLAHRMTTDARSFVKQAKTAQEKFAANVAEYWLEENPQLVRPRSVESFAEQVRTLRDDVARLEKRVERLTKKNA